jgi:hypothetical protein
LGKAAQRARTAQLDQLTIRQRLAHELNERKAAIPGILDALVAKAQKGDVPAAREFRACDDQGPFIDGSIQDDPQDALLAVSGATTTAALRSVRVIRRVDVPKRGGGVRPYMEASQRCGR